MGEPMLSIEDVDVAYGRTTVVHRVTVQVAADGVTSLLGHNGAGKTTVLRAAAGLLPVAHGRIRLDGEDITGLAPNRRVRRGLAYVPQGQQAFGRLTARENLQVVADGRRRGRELTDEASEPVATHYVSVYG